MTELDALDPTPEYVTLVSGKQLALEDLRARQFFKLLRIVTHGAMPTLADGSLLQLSGDLDTAEFTGRLVSLVLLSIPDAEEETIEFVQSMCKPAGLIEGRKLNKADTERNTALLTDMYMELDNPTLDDLVTIIEAIVRRESADIQALGKRLAGMFKLAEKTGQTSSRGQTSSKKTLTSSAGSRARSTSSRTNTDGPTTPSETSPSNGSDNA